jgi:hypothetical protein
MAAKKSRSHLVTVRVHFDHPVTRGAALRACRNNLVYPPGYGEFYASIYEAENDDWEMFKIKSVK